jgi:transcriptional regulator with XRE-family HTH domain
MSKVAEYKNFIGSIRSGLGYWKSYSLLQFTNSLVRLMKLENVQGKDLATRLGVSATQVSKVLSGQENVTVETMAKFADALDAIVHVHVAKRGMQVQWQERPAQKIKMPQTPAAFHQPNDTVVDFNAVRLAKLQVQDKFIEATPRFEEAYG